MSPTMIVFVPGGWHDPSCFSSVSDKLQEVGYKASFVHHPSVADPAPKFKDFSADVAEVRSHLQAAVDAGHDVLVFMHSYGGVVGTEAVKGFAKVDRAKNGQSGGVVQLFYCCSFVLPEGKSLMTAFGDAQPPWFDISEDRLVVNPATPVETFYNDMSPDMVKEAVSKLKPMSFQTFSTEITYAAWKHVPSTYLYCLKDQAIPIWVQKMMVEESAKGAGIRTETVDAGHSPFYSQPEAVVGAVRRAAGELVQ